MNAIYQLTIGGTPFEVTIVDETATTLTAQVNGEEYLITLGPQPGDNCAAAPEPRSAPETSGRRPARTGGRQSYQPTADYCVFGSGNVEAPIPGKILAVHVQQGQQVAKGEKLLVLEAMKMENVLLATRPGVVRELLVAAGDSVGQDQPLIILAEEDE